jgi:hypothetical protein
LGDNIQTQLNQKVYLRKNADRNKEKYFSASNAKPRYKEEQKIEEGQH